VACHATKNNFSEGIQKLVSPWTKCIEKKWDYMEKWCSCKFCIAFVLIKKICCGWFLTHPHSFSLKSKKAKLYLYLTNHNAMKTYGGRGGIDLCILNP
jgi:hypothetical protein